MHSEEDNITCGGRAAVQGSVFFFRGVPIGFSIENLGMGGAVWVSMCVGPFEKLRFFIVMYSGASAFWT